MAGGEAPAAGAPAAEPAPAAPPAEPPAAEPPPAPPAAEPPAAPGARQVQVAPAPAAMGETGAGLSMKELKDSLAEVRLKTMHKMVKSVLVPNGPGIAPSTCKLLYLENKDIAAFPNFPLACKKLGCSTKNYNLVIQLMPSYMGKAWWKAHPWGRERFPAKRTPEASEEDADIVDHQMLLFAKDVLIPMAVNSRAIVIGQECCDLTTAFVKASLQVQSQFQQFKEECPFKLLIFCRAHFCDIKARDKHSIAHNFWMAAEPWRSKADIFKKALLGRYGNDEAFHPHADLYPGQYSLVMFECLSEDAAGTGRLETNDLVSDFKSKFIKSLSDVPVIALQLHGTGPEPLGILPGLAEHVADGNQLMLIDTRRWPNVTADGRVLDSKRNVVAVVGTDEDQKAPRGKAPDIAFGAGGKLPMLFDLEGQPILESFPPKPPGHEQTPQALGLCQETSDPFDEFVRQRSPEKPAMKLGLLPRLPSSIEHARKVLDAFAARLHNEGVADWYQISAMAFMKAVINNMQRARSESENGDDHGTKGGRKLRKQSEMWIYEAITDCRRKIAEKDANQGAHGHADDDHEDPAVEGATALMKYVGGEFEWEAKTRHARFHRACEDIMEADTWPDFAARVEENWTAIRGCAFHNRANFHLYRDWADEVDAGEQATAEWFKGRFRIVVRPEKANGVPLQQAKDELLELFWKQYEVSNSISLSKITQKAFSSNEKKWLALYEIFDSNLVVTGSLHDLAECRNTLEEIGKIDYLPDENSLEALVLLRRAWAIRDLYMHSAEMYKWWTKKSFILCLYIQAAIVSLVTFHNFISSQQTGMQYADWWLAAKKHSLLALSLGATVINSLLVILAPARKWHGLRGAAIKLESEIWKFRTRMGEYESTDYSLYGRVDQEKKAERTFKESMEQQIEEVRSGASLQRTAFFHNWTTLPDTVKQFEQEDVDKSMCPLPNIIRRQLALQRAGSKMRNMIHCQFDLKQPPLQEYENNHHSPLQPDDYVRYRLIKQRDFYQGRIPMYARTLFAIQVIMIAGTIINAVLSSRTGGTWESFTVLVTSFTGSFMAWIEFLDLEKKLDRFSTLGAALDEIIVFWQSLKEDERMKLSNIRRLVAGTEVLITAQLNSWLSHQQKNKSKEAGGSSSGGKT